MLGLVAASKLLDTWWIERDGSQPCLVFLCPVCTQLLVAVSERGGEGQRGGAKRGAERGGRRVIAGKLDMRMYQYCLSQYNTPPDATTAKVSLFGLFYAQRQNLLDTQVCPDAS